MYKFFIVIFFMFSANFAPAEILSQNSTYNVIKETHTTNGLIIQTGAQVRALGVIDVPVDLVPSGKLFTCIYQD